MTLFSRCLILLKMLHFTRGLTIGIFCSSEFLYCYFIKILLKLIMGLWCCYSYCFNYFFQTNADISNSLIACSYRMLDHVSIIIWKLNNYSYCFSFFEFHTNETLRLLRCFICMVLFTLYIIIVCIGLHGLFLLVLGQNNCLLKHY